MKIVIKFKTHLIEDVVKMKSLMKEIILNKYRLWKLNQELKED